MDPSSRATGPDDWDAVNHEVDRRCQPNRDAPLSTTVDHIPDDPPAKGSEGFAPPNLPEFEILAELGRGGMGIVYLARRKDTGEHFALKMLREVASLDAKVRDRFLKECEAALRLRHANIVRGFEPRQFGGVPYLVLEYVKGQTLAQKLNRQPLEERAAARLTRTLAGALAHAHERGVFHRDLKPSNVLLDADGEPKVTDFGLARLVDSSGQTTDGRVLGTPQYMAPEQARGENAQATAAVDIYSLGATLYEMLTGRPPFLAASVAAIIAQVGDRTQAPARPRSLNPEVSPGIEAICLKCLEKEPILRYASAGHLAADLTRFLGGEPVQAPLWTWARAGLRLARHNPLPASLMALLCVVVLGSAVWLFAKYQAEAQARNLAESRLYYQTLQRADLLGVTEPDEALDLLHNPTRFPPRFRSFDWEMLVQRFGPPARSLVGHERDVFAVDFSRDGNTLATGGADNSVRLWDVRSGQTRLPLVGHKAPVTSVCFAPDGGRVASADGAGLIILWDAASGRHLFELGSETLPAINCVVFSPDGKTLASGHNDGVIRLWDLEHKSLARKLSDHTRPISSLSFSPDGKTLASGAGGLKEVGGIPFTEMLGAGEVKWWSLADDQPHNVEGVVGAVSAVAFSPGTGQYLAYASRDRSVALLDVAHGYKPVAHFARTAGSASLAFSPDGTLLAVGSENDSTNSDGESMATIRVYDVEFRTERCQLRGHPKCVHAVAFAPVAQGGRPLLASAGCDGSLQLRPLPVGRESVELPWPAGGTSADEPSAVALSADGRRLLAAHDRDAVVWDLSTLDAPRVLRELPRQTAPLPGHTQTIKAVALSTDGRRAATAGRDTTICLWDLAAPAAPPLVLRHGAVVTSLVFLPDGETLVSGGEDHRVKLWDAQDGQTKGELEGRSGPVVSLAVSRDGRFLATGGDCGNAGEVLLWDVRRKRLLKRLEAPGGIEPVNGVAFSPDGKTLASGHNGGSSRTGVVRVWDVAGQGLLASWKVERGAVQALAFAPDGRSLVTSCCPDQKSPSVVQFWDRSGEERLLLRGSTGHVQGLSFAADPVRRFATIRPNGTAVVWEGVEGYGPD